MKLKNIVAIATLSLLLFSCNKENAKEKELSAPTAEYDQYSYALGYDIGSNYLKALDDDSINVNLDYVYRGIADGLKIQDTTFTALLSKEERDSVMQNLQNMMSEKQQAKAAERQAKYEERSKVAKESGEKFLAENKNKPGVITTKSGLQYKVINEGQGIVPKENYKVQFHVIGKFLDGEEFQNTYSMPTVPELVIKEIGLPAWKEAFLTMKVGSKWEIYAPPHLAYGEEDTGVIPPHSVVIFEIELINAAPEESDAQK